MLDPKEHIQQIEKLEQVEKTTHPEFFNDLEEPSKPRVKRWWIWLLVLLAVLLLIVLVYLFNISNSLRLILVGRRPNPLVEVKNIIDPNLLKGEAEGDINVLFMGMRGEGQEYSYATNAVMLVNYDLSKNAVNTISFSRDFLVPLQGQTRKIGTICELAGANPLDCTVLGTEVLENVTGLKIHYAFVSDFQGFTHMIDDVKRIDVNLKGKSKEYPFLQDKEFDSARDATDPEVFHLNGEQSLIFVRWPKDATPDFGRIERQQIFLSAAEDQLLDPNLILNPGKLKNVLESGSKHVRTNFQIWEILKFANLVSGAAVNKFSLNTDLNSKGGLLKASGRSDHSLIPIEGENSFGSIQKFVSTIVNEN